MKLEDLGIVPVHVAFPGLNYDFAEFKKLLGTLNRTEALIWCCGLNCMVSHPFSSDIARNVELAVQAVFDKVTIKEINEFAKQHGGVRQITVLFKGQLLELMRWVCLFSPNDPQKIDAFNEDDIRRNFAMALLMASHVWQERIQHYEYKSKATDITTRRTESMPFFRQLVSGFNRFKDPDSAFGRGYQLFVEKFRPLYADCEKKFLTACGLSLEDYFACLRLIVNSFLHDGKTKVEEFLFHRDRFWKALSHKHEELKTFMNGIVQSVDDLSASLWDGITDSIPKDAPKYNYTIFVEKPVLQTADGRMIIIDPMFLLQKASVGPLFALASLTRGTGSREPFQTFGLAFEDYAAECLKTAFQADAKRFECNLTEKDEKTPEIIDACLNNLDKAVLFETKSFFIPETSVLNDNPDTYRQKLLERYGHGLEQLSTAIKNLESGNWTPKNPDQDFSRVEVVYPVLLVHDVLFDIPTQTDFLAEQFRKVLAPGGMTNSFYKVGRFAVVPLIILTVDILEQIENSLREFDFVELLNDYHHANPTRTDGLLDYIRTASKYRGRLQRNSRLLNNYKQIMQMVRGFIISHHDIAERAHNIWLGSGSTHGHDQTDWYQAEEELWRASQL